MLPIGARTVFRALRTRAASQIGIDWVWPFWLRRQIDPASPAFVPRGHLPVPVQRDQPQLDDDRQPSARPARPWSTRGVWCRPWHDGWSLDWWIGAEDRWHVPADEANVRQALVGDSPVVETAHAGARRRHHPPRRTPSGPPQPTAARSWSSSRSRTTPPCPVALALAVRPYDAEGLSVIERIGLHGTTVTVDGRVAMLLPRQPPNAVAASTFHDGDCATAVFAGDAAAVVPRRPARRGRHGPGRVRLPAAAPRHAAGGAARSSRDPAPAWTAGPGDGCSGRRASPASLPSAEQVANGLEDARPTGACAWCCPTSGCSRRSTPTAATCSCSTTAPTSRPGPAPTTASGSATPPTCSAALDRYGFHHEAREVLASYPGRQHSDGFFFSQRLEWDANGAALWALGPPLGPDPRRRRCSTSWCRRSPAASSGSSASAGGSRRERPRPRAACCPPASRPSTSARTTTSTGTTSGRSPASATAPGCSRAAGEDERRRRGRRVPRVDDRRRARAPWPSPPSGSGTEAVPAGPRRRIDPGVIGSLAAVLAARAAAGRRPGHAGHPRRRPRPVLHRRGLLPGHQPHRSRHLPHPAAGLRRAARRRPPGARPARLVPGRRHADLDLARGDPPPGRRRLHGRRPPRLGGRRAAVVRAHDARPRDRRRSGAGVDDPRALVRAGRRGPRRAHPLRPAVVRHPLARRTARRCCGSSSRTTPTWPSCSPAPGLDPDAGARPRSGARRCSRRRPAAGA